MTSSIFSGTGDIDSIFKKLESRVKSLQVIAKATTSSAGGVTSTAPEPVLISPRLHGPEEDVLAQIKSNEALLIQIEAEADATKTKAMIRDIEAEQDLADRIREIQISKFSLSEVIEMRQGQLAEIQRLEEVGVEQTAEAALRELEIRETLAADVQALERQTASLRQATRNAELTAAVSIGNALVAFTGKKSKAIFLASRALSVALAVNSAKVASALALANPPGPPATIPLAKAVLISGLANAASIAAQALTASTGGGSASIPSVGANPSGVGLSTSQPNSQNQPVEINLIVQALDPESVNWDRVIADVMESAGNHINRGGSTGPVTFNVERN